MTSPDRDYWNKRARQYGPLSVGYTDPVLYQYEERLRWSALIRTCAIDPGMHVLDIGCGVGRWSVRLASLGCHVVGTDISPAMLQMAIPSEYVEYRQGAVQDLDFADASFDLIVSITVLQHITSARAFERALNNIARMLKQGGQVAVLEYSPRKMDRAESDAQGDSEGDGESGSRNDPEYMRSRTYQEWIDAFAPCGFALDQECGVRFIGHWFYPRYMSRLARLFPRINPSGSDGDPTNWMGRLPRSLMWAVDLTLARLPFMTRLSDVHCMVFRKTGA
jgi:ubiquinone/menaquinone biosynthesis C-methylase UbiE